MKITAAFVNKTARLGVGNPITIETPETDLESVFRRLLYRYGEVVASEVVDPSTKRYVLVSRQQYDDTRESYELETELTIQR